MSQQDFQSEISDQILEINTQLGQISRDVGGSRMLRFDNIQDQTTRRDFQALVEETTPRTGTLAVKNKMSSGQYIYVNRVEYYIGAGQQEEIEGPIGQCQHAACRTKSRQLEYLRAEVPTGIQIRTGAGTDPNHSQVLAASRLRNAASRLRIVTSRLRIVTVSTNRHRFMSSPSAIGFLNSEPRPGSSVPDGQPILATLLDSSATFFMS